MADIHSKDIRSYNMSRVKCKDTKIELLVRKHLFSKGFRYRLHDKKLPGKPDIILPKYKTIIFINGCFWHGHNGCRFYSVPKTRSEWWASKIEKNKANDETVQNKLRDKGWKIILIWGCELKKNSIQDTLEKISERILNDSG